MTAIRLGMLALLLSLPTWANEKHDDHDKEAGHSDEAPHKEGAEKHEEEGESPNVGPGKAVEALGHDGMKLSAKATAALGLKTVPLKGRSPYRVPFASLVFFRDEVGVYRLRDGWLKLVEVVVPEKTKLEATIRTSGLKPGDQVVISGVARLRVVEMDATSGEVGHGH